MAPGQQHNTVSVTKAPFTTKCRDSLAILAQHPPSQDPGIMTMSQLDTVHGPETCECTPDHSSEAGIGML